MSMGLNALGLDALGLDALGLDDLGLDDLGLDDQTSFIQLKGCTYLKKKKSLKE